MKPAQVPAAREVVMRREITERPISRLLRDAELYPRGVRLFYYYGRKYKHSVRYPAPEFRTVVEPFAGAAGYSCWNAERGRIDHAVLVDRDPVVVDLWHRLLSGSPLPDLVPIGEFTSDPYIMFQANSANPRRKLLIGNMTSPRRQEIVRKMTERLRPHCSGFDVRLGSYTDIEDDLIDNPELTWFIDPPYQVVDGGKTRGSGYRFGAEQIDYEHLAEWCRRIAGQVIVCESYGATWLPFTPVYQHPAMSGKPTTEVIWTNERVQGAT